MSSKEPVLNANQKDIIIPFFYDVFSIFFIEDPHSKSTQIV